MSKFKKGEFVVHRLNASGTIFKVRELLSTHHEAFTSEYMYLEGIEQLVNQDDYIPVGSLAELSKYAIEGCIVFMAGIVSTILTFWLWTIL